MWEHLAIQRSFIGAESIVVQEAILWTQYSEIVITDLERVLMWDLTEAYTRGG